jgi:uncharacterized metal-binding protein YceD (DUF177 family)
LFVLARRDFRARGFDLGSDAPYHARAMGNLLRDRRTAAEWAAVKQVIDFKDKISDFGQLSAIVGADLAALDAAKIPADWRETLVSGRLSFGFADAQRLLPVVNCRASVNVDVVCQRCLETFQLPLEVEGELLLLEFDQEVEGYDDYEVWELEEPLLRPLDIVEELLIMALPFAAMHTESAACRALCAAEQDAAEEMTMPFAALREQMEEDNEGSA